MKHDLPPTRDRLVQAAIALFQTQGYFATSVNDILVDAQAPKGSLYHYFPGGKADLAMAAIAAIEWDVASWMQRARERGVAASDAVQLLAQGMASWMRRSNGAQGSLLSVLAMECAAREPAVHAAVTRAYAAWRKALADAIDGDRKQARATADLIIATLEGGLILARIDGKTAPFTAAAERLVQLLASAAPENG
jgi:TetR/AcrR family transcriptional repressor of lmrAB and yxaGH operons